jgi:hypothetical protein
VNIAQNAAMKLTCLILPKEADSVRVAQSMTCGVGILIVPAAVAHWAVEAIAIHQHPAQIIPVGAVHGLSQLNLQA